MKHVPEIFSRLLHHGSLRMPILLFILFHTFVAAQQKESRQTARQDHVLILTATGGIFDQARNELVNELRDEFSLSMVEMTGTPSFGDIDREFIRQNEPKAVVLIGNNAIRFYVQYALERDGLTESVQVVTILALDVERAVSGLSNVNAIAYETPMVTALVNFRRVTGGPVTRVGVLYREPLREFVERHKRFCRNENIEIKGIEIGGDTLKHRSEIAESLKSLLGEGRVEALWIANDDVLLKPHLLGEVWLPALKRKKVPLVVGIESLVDPGLNFGTFAVIPDPASLGEQAAEIIYNLKFDDWSHKGVVIHPAISMYSVLNLKKALEFTNKKNIRTYEVSKVLNKKK